MIWLHRPGMVEITAKYDGDLRTTATHGPSGRTLITDAPVDNHGKGESFSPTDLCAAALVSCMATIMGIKARSLGVDLAGMSLHVEKHMSTDAPRRIIQLPVTIHAPEAISEENRTSLEQAALSCPVFKSLDPEIEKTLVIYWDQ
ncbi:MAG: OsmC family protein [Verrucomicrobiota bacterium]